jgi:hypothetical protein
MLSHWGLLLPGPVANRTLPSLLGWWCVNHIDLFGLPLFLGDRGCLVPLVEPYPSLCQPLLVKIRGASPLRFLQSPGEAIGFANVVGELTTIVKGESSVGHTPLLSALVVWWLAVAAQ